MQKQECTSCHKPKASLQCGICQVSLCKYCAQFLEEGGFSFLSKVPDDLSHSVYCSACYEAKVAPALEAYSQTMEQAKEIAVYFDSQGKETRLIKRINDPVRVKDCSDRDETILRLAFFAAQAGLNALVDVRVTSEKVKTGSYQKLQWSGTAVPAHVNPDKLIKDRSFSSSPN